MDKDRILSDLVYRGRLPHGWKHDPDLRIFSSPKGKKYVTERDRYMFMRDHTCAICGYGPDPDIRHLTIGCSYDVREVSWKFYLQEDNSFRMEICKGCRAEFLFTHLTRFIESKGRLVNPDLEADGLVAPSAIPN